MGDEEIGDVLAQIGVLEDELEDHQYEVQRCEDEIDELKSKRAAIFVADAKKLADWEAFCRESR